MTTSSRVKPVPALTIHVTSASNSSTGVADGLAFCSVLRSSATALSRMCFVMASRSTFDQSTCCLLIGYDGFHLRIVDRPRGTRPRFVEQPIAALVDKPLPPAAHRRL